MEYIARKVGKVERLGDIYQVAAPLDRQFEAFKEVGIFTLATPEEVAQIRLNGFSDYGSRTNIAPIAIKGAKTILYRDSPLMSPLMAASAVRCHRKGVYFTQSKEIYEEAQAIAKTQEGIEPENRNAIVVSQEGDFSLTSQMPESRFILRRQAKDYFEKKTNGKIPFRNLTCDFEDRAIVNYIWFVGLQDETDIYCKSKGLGDLNGAVGVLRTAEGSTQKTGYSLIEIGKANSEIIPKVFESTGIPALTNMVSSQLNKDLLERLRKKE